MQIFQPISKAFLEGGRQSRRLLCQQVVESKDLKEKRVDINPSIATEYFLRVKGSIDFFK